MTKTTEWNAPSNEEIHKILVQRIDVERQGIGIVVGVIDANGARIVAHGAPSRDATRPLDGDAVFEIGSITKAFTSLLLSDMVERGEVALDDPVVRYLPQGVTMPERGGRQITLLDLATHTSGLPRRPGDLSPGDWTNPYASYTVDQLHRYLSNHTLRRDIGTNHLYSNLGTGLLGHVLALRAGLSYEALIGQRIAAPLGMAGTAITLSPDMKARFTVGHDQELQPVAHWDFPSLAGAGALRSTANDLLRFLGAELGFVDTPLQTAMAAQIAPRRPTQTGDIQALGWVISPSEEDGEIVWHGGATGGYRCFVLFERDRRVGVVVLMNTASARNDDIGFHLLNGRSLLPPPPKRRAISVDAAVLERYVGGYRFSTWSSMSVIRENERLFLELSIGGQFEMYPESEIAFFLKNSDALVTFDVESEGGVTGLVVHQRGTRRALRIS